MPHPPPKILTRPHSDLLACFDCGRLLILVVDKQGPVVGCYACDLWEDLWSPPPEVYL